MLGMYLISVTIRWWYMYRSSQQVFNVEQHLYLKIAILHGRSAWECYVELCEALGDHGLTAWVQAFRSGRGSALNMYLVRQ
jgi:hypothetical protein